MLNLKMYNSMLLNSMIYILHYPLYILVLYVYFANGDYPSQS